MYLRTLLFVFIGTVINGLTLWIPLLVVFYLFFTPVSIWYSTTHVYDLTHYLEVSFEKSLKDVIVDRLSWYSWHQKNLIGVNSFGNETTEGGILSTYSLIDTTSKF
jgi:hypothetical protein